MLDRGMILILIKKFNGQIIAQDKYIEVDFPSANETIVFEFNDEGILTNIY